LKKQAEKAAKKKPRRKQADVEDPVESDAEPEQDLEPSESGLQSPIMSVHFASVCTKMIYHQQED